MKQEVMTAAEYRRLHTGPLVAAEEKRKPAQLEAALQRACFDYFRAAGIFAFAVPNGGSRNVIEATNMKRAGVMAGVADICIPLDGGCLWIELKVGKNKTTEAQDAFARQVRRRRGHRYVVARSLDEVIAAIAVSTRPPSRTTGEE